MPMQKSSSTPYLPKPSQRLTPGETPPRYGGPVAGHIRSSPSVDNLATYSSALPADELFDLEVAL